MHTHTICLLTYIPRQGAFSINLQTLTSNFGLIAFGNFCKLKNSFKIRKINPALYCQKFMRKKSEMNKLIGNCLLTLYPKSERGEGETAAAVCFSGEGCGESEGVGTEERESK